MVESFGDQESGECWVDLGVSSLQFDSPERGFSFRFDAPLDMRMNRSEKMETAADLLLSLPEGEIARLIFEYGEERNSRRIAQWIVESREQGKPIKTTKDLADLVYPRSPHTEDGIIRQHGPFQAFVVLAVNGELEGLDNFIVTAIEFFYNAVPICCDQLHSLEDRIIKQELRRLSGYCQCPPRVPICQCGTRRAVELLTRRPVTPSITETDQNPRARSAKLRACMKII